METDFLFKYRFSYNYPYFHSSLFITNWHIQTFQITKTPLLNKGLLLRTRQWRICHYVHPPDLPKSVCVQMPSVHLVRGLPTLHLIFRFVVATWELLTPNGSLSLRTIWPNRCRFNLYYSSSYVGDFSKVFRWSDDTYILISCMCYIEDRCIGVVTNFNPATNLQPR